MLLPYIVLRGAAYLVCKEKLQLPGLEAVKFINKGL